MRSTPLERFQRHISDLSPDAPCECWVWSGAKLRGGYGSFWSGEYIRGDYRNGPVMVQAHRWSYQHFIGPIPDGLNVLHHCDTPACVNPQHLFAGTQRENVDDATAKRRRLRKLTPETILRIRETYRRGGISQRELALKFATSQANVSRIVNGLTSW